MNKKLLNIFCFTLITGISFAAFSATSPGGFLSDDFGFIYNVSRMTASGVWRVFIPAASWGFYRPIGILYWWLCFKLFGMNSFGYWALSVLVHSINGFLIFLILKKFKTGLVGALAGGLVFVAFPLHGEAVAWLSGGFDRLCLLFMLSGLYAYMRYLEDKRPVSYALSLASFAAALFSKEMALTYPALVLLLDIIAGERPLGDIKGKVLRISPFFLMAAAYLVIRLMVFHGMGGYVGANGRSMHTTLDPDVIYSNVINIPVLLLFPVNRLVPGDPRVLMGCLAGLYLLAIISRAINGGAGIRPALFGLAWIPVAYLPVMTLYVTFRNLIDGRFSYVPSVGLALMAGTVFGLSKNLSRTGHILKIGTLAALLICYLLLCGRNYSTWAAAYDNARFIPREVVRMVPDPPRGSDFYFIGPYDNLDGAYVFRNGLEEAVNLQYGLNSGKGIKVGFIDDDGRVKGRPKLSYRDLVRSRRDNLFIFFFQNSTGRLLLVYPPPRMPVM